MAAARFRKGCRRLLKCFTQCLRPDAPPSPRMPRANQDPNGIWEIPKELGEVLTKDCFHLEDHVDKTNSSPSLQEEPGHLEVPVLLTQVSVVNDGVPQPEEPVPTTQAAPELESVARKAPELEPFEDPNDESEVAPLMHPISDSVQSDNRAVTAALEKVSESCFDLFPVIRSHLHAGGTLSIPIMTAEEEEVVYEFGITKKCLAEPLLQAILKKLKVQKTSLSSCHIHSLCRVYVGISRHLGDLEKARLFCYSLLKEEFPESGKLILFMGNMWSEIFTSEGVINKAVQLVARRHSNGQVLKCLKTALNWEESGPADLGMMVSSLLMAIQLCPQMEFQKSEQHGEDLRESMWEDVLGIDLLCSHQKWVWTHDHIIRFPPRKEFWPIMDKRIKSKKGSGRASTSSDVIPAAVLRLTGRLSQIGLKEGFLSAVKNISSAIGAFLRQAKEKVVLWGVLLAEVYALFELGPSSPSEI